MAAKRLRKICAVLTTAAMMSATAPAMYTVAYARSKDVDTWTGIAGAVIGLFGGKKTSGSSASSGGGGLLSGLGNQKHSRPNPSREEKLFLLAVKQNDFETAQAMLDAGVDIDLVAKEGFVWSSAGETAFMIAMYHNNRDMMQFLLERGADVNGYYTFDGKYVCYIAQAAVGHFTSFGADPELIKYLHECGANINGIDTINDRYGSKNAVNAIIARAAEFSRKSGDIASARYLAENGINLDNVQSPDCMSTVSQRTPFLAAVNMKWYDMAKLLADHGANLNARDAYGKTALDIALEKNDLQYYKQIQEIIARGQQPSKYQEIHAAEQKKAARVKEYNKFMTAINEAMTVAHSSMTKSNGLMDNKSLSKQTAVKEYQKIIKENEKAIKTLDEKTSAAGLGSFTVAERAEFDKMRQTIKDVLQSHNSLMQYGMMDRESMSESDWENCVKQAELHVEKAEEMKKQIDVLKKLVS